MLGCATAVLLLVSCDRVIGLRDGYYLSSAAGGVGGAGFAGAFTAGSGATGGTGSALGGEGQGGSAGTDAIGGSPTAGAGDGGGGATPVAGAGNGGAPDVLLCAEHPLPAESTWVPTASPVAAKYPPASATDGAPTRWTTGQAQSGGEWLQIDFGQPVAIRRVNLQQGPTYSNDYPRGYAVFVSDTPMDLGGTMVATGVGASGVTTTIVLSSVFVGRYLLIEQLQTSLSWWSVEEVEVSCYDG